MLISGRELPGELVGDSLVSVSDSVNAPRKSFQLAATRSEGIGTDSLGRLDRLAIVARLSRLAKKTPNREPSLFKLPAVYLPGTGICEQRLKRFRQGDE